jgi:hypothetical protein
VHADFCLRLRRKCGALVETPGAKDPPIGVAGPEAVLQKHFERGFLSIRVEDGRKGSYGVNDVGRRLGWHPEREKSAMGKSERLKELFAVRHFDREVILLCGSS